MCTVESIDGSLHDGLCEHLVDGGVGASLIEDVICNQIRIGDSLGIRAWKRTWGRTGAARTEGEGDARDGRAEGAVEGDAVVLDPPLPFAGALLGDRGTEADGHRDPLHVRGHRVAAATKRGAEWSEKEGKGWSRGWKGGREFET